jgi:DNA primase
MAKLAQNFAKYLIHMRFSSNGVVEKPDVIGAIFGQTEGLLGQDLDLRELQKTGRIGRIDVIIETENGKSSGDITIPSSLDASETSLIAASLETIDKVGPCDAEIKIVKIKDVRSQKRRYVVDRAKEILKEMIVEESPDSQKMSESVKEAVRSHEVSSYFGLSCGPNIEGSDEIIVVEGRADVINLLKNGIRNVIAIEGSKIPDTVIALTKEKVVTAFLDGDRGGDLDLKKLLAVAEIDFVARAETDKEVEELTKKQIFKALRERVPVDRIVGKKIQEKKEEIREDEIDKNKMKFLRALLEDLTGSRAAYLIDKNYKILSKVPLSEIADLISNDVHTIVFDGKINQSIVDLALQKKVSYLVGTGYKEKVNSGPVRILTMRDFK